MNKVQELRLLLSFGLATAASGNVQAQSLPAPVPPNSSVATVRPTAADVTPFIESLSALSKKHGLLFVVEAVPYLAPRAKAPEQGAVPVDQPLQEQVHKIADAWDYSAEPLKNQPRIFLLKKRYSDAADLPAVTLLECAAAIENTLRLMDRFNPRVPPPTFGVRDALVGDLMATLSADQLQAMQQKRLRVASLNPAQQQSIERFARYFYVQGALRSSQRTVQRLRAVIRSGAVFCYQERGGSRLFGVEIVSSSTQSAAPEFIPLTLPNSRQLPTNGGVVAAPIITDDIPLPMRGKGLPEKAMGGAEAKPQFPAPFTTLRQAVQALSDRSRVSENGLGLAVDKSIALKPVALIGTEHAPPVTALRAAASVYGLQVVGSNDGSLLLTLPRPRRVDNIMQLSGAVHDIWPESLRRAMQAEKWDKPIAATPAGGSSNAVETPEARRERIKDQIWRIGVLQERPKSLRAAAAARLTSTVEPRLKEAPNERLPVSALDFEERSALANVLMVDAYVALQSLIRSQPPDYISRLSEAYLTGGTYKDAEGKTKFSVFISLPGTDGQILQGPGVGNVNYIK